MSESPLSVFLNCPFDAAYKATFEALIFTVTASGYRVRCALEEQDSADIRFDKLCRLIAESDHTIHDLSRTELGPNDLPRFNMPFELGLAMGAKRFGVGRQRRKTALIMVAEPYRLPAYLSDLGGNDLSAHHNDPRQAIRIVRNYLQSTPEGNPLPGPQRFTVRFEQFQAALPTIAAQLQIAAHEIDAYNDYRTYLWCLAEFMKTVQTEAAGN